MQQTKKNLQHLFEKRLSIPFCLSLKNIFDRGMENRYNNSDVILLRIDFKFEQSLYNFWTGVHLKKKIQWFPVELS